jgi:hypothetical protein
MCKLAYVLVQAGTTKIEQEGSQRVYIYYCYLINCHVLTDAEIYIYLLQITFTLTYLHFYLYSIYRFIIFTSTVM